MFVYMCVPVYMLMTVLMHTFHLLYCSVVFTLSLKFRLLVTKDKISNLWINRVGLRLQRSFVYWDKGELFLKRPVWLIALFRYQCERSIWPQISKYKHTWTLWLWKWYNYLVYPSFNLCTSSFPPDTSHFVYIPSFTSCLSPYLHCVYPLMYFVYTPLACSVHIPLFGSSIAFHLLCKYDLACTQPLLYRSICSLISHFLSSRCPIYKTMTINGWTPV